MDRERGVRKGISKKNIVMERNIESKILNQKTQMETLFKKNMRMPN